MAQELERLHSTLLWARRARELHEAGAACASPIWNALVDRIRLRAEQVGEDAATVYGMLPVLATDVRAMEASGLAHDDVVAAGSYAEVLEAFWVLTRDEIEPIATAVGDGEINGVVDAMVARLRHGARRGATLTPFDFRRVVLDASTVGTVRTCALWDVGTPVPTTPADHAPGHRAIAVAASCRTTEGTSSVVLLWLSRAEGLRVLDSHPSVAAPAWIAVRVMRAGSSPNVSAEATLDGRATTRLEALRRVYDRLFRYWPPTW